MKPINRNLLKAAVLCIGIQDISAGAATPALGVIIAAFPHINPSIVMMITTIPSLCMVLFSPFYAKLTEILNKKTILRIAIVLFMIGGVAPAFLNNIWWILASRFVFGIAIGFVFPMVIGLGMGLTLPSITAKTTSLVPPATSTFAVSMVTTFMGIGAFVETFFLNLIQCQQVKKKQLETSLK